jgi:citrate lyase subunit beta/citryl-CoA lyase
VLFVPASSQKMLEKARTLACDVVVLDLEDAVAPELKDTARARGCAAVKSLRDGVALSSNPTMGGGSGREIVIRINALDSVWGKYDLAAARSAKPDAILLPKVTGAADVAATRNEIPLWAMIETPLAMLNVAAIAASGVVCLALGTNDLLNDMRGHPLPDRRNLWAALSQTVIAARAHGLGVIDGTYNEIGDTEGFAVACAQGKAFGFDGKTLIHPAQIQTANRIFAPSEAEIADSRLILAAFERPENNGKGAIALDGRMVERLHADNAARILAMAKAIAERP